jgi:small-conductance mechanosensitive channel
LFNGTLDGISKEIILMVSKYKCKAKECTQKIFTERLSFADAYARFTINTVEIIKTVPIENPKVISDPSPLALFEGYGDDGTLDFRLLFWTHVDVGLSSKSEVGLAIYEELQKRGYELPVQKSTIRLEGNNTKF